MGISIFGSSSSYDRKCERVDTQYLHTAYYKQPSSDIEPPTTLQPSQQPDVLPNPDPNNYSIVKSYEMGNYLAIMICYHDCINYEGNKIMVYENCTKQDLISQKYIDPHFTDNSNFKSPICRFEPTDRGWNDAQNFIDLKVFK